MGADIHAVAEIKWGANNKWVKVTEPIWEYPFFNKDKPVGFWNTPYTNEPLVRRDYPLFAYLADVRNYVDIEPLSPPRGIPKGASKKFKSIDYHSHTYFTHTELLEALDELETDNRVIHFSDADTTYYERFYEVIKKMLEPLQRVHALGYEIRYLFAFDN